MDIKEIIKEKYGTIATKSTPSGCSCGCGEGYLMDYTVMGDEYKGIEGYVPEADLGLGCGLPTEFADIKSGDTVLDLGSGAGNDVFIARRIVGETGKVIGLDFTKEMIEKANKNNEKLGYKNVSFVYGEIEEMPLENNLANVVISNCVLNLVPDKTKAFAEIYRVLKTGGHFCVSDIVLQGALPENIKNAAIMYAGCVSGALDKTDYLKLIEETGFKNVCIKKDRKIDMPDEILLQFISEKELDEFKSSDNNLYSITVVAEKQ